jgi:cell wall-associated NlpC family hydrolase
MKETRATVASHRTKRAVRAAVSVVAAISVAGFLPAPALALTPTHQQPPPPPETASEALQQYNALSEQAEQVNEQLLAAREDLAAKQAEFNQATADLAEAEAAKVQAAADEETFRGQVDLLAGASFQGARFNKLSALLTGSSAEDFLERAAALGVLASDSEEALTRLTTAVNQAAAAQTKALDAQTRAAEATAAAQTLTDQVTKTSTDLAAQIEAVEDAYDELSGADQDELAGGNDNSAYFGPPGLGGRAAEIAMSQRGKMYLWGATGPDRYDCSGLMVWSYRQVGIELPRSSRSQYGVGKSVPFSDLRAGDLVFYGSPIHHVAMAISNTEVVHASRSGVPVKVADAAGASGSDVVGVKRISG